MSNITKIVGSNIKELRLHKGLTREQLAERCGMQVSYLAGVERGDRNITLESFEKISKGLEYPPSALMKINNSHIENNFLEKEDMILEINEQFKKISFEELKSLNNIINEIFKLNKIN